MGALSRNSAMTSLNPGATSAGFDRRRNFCTLIARHFQHAFCADVVCGACLLSGLAMDPARFERELFVFTGPYSPHYQEPKRLSER